MKSKRKNSFTLRLSEDQLETLKAIAERERRTVSSVVRNLIDDIKSEPKEQRKEQTKK